MLDSGHGRGTPLVLLHGTGAHSGHWQWNIPALAQDRQVVAIDFPGFGGSELSARDASVEGYARTVLTAADRLDLTRFDVCGHSLGGLVGAEIAQMAPERVRRLVLVGGSASAILLLARSPVRGALRHPSVARAVAVELLLARRAVTPALASAAARRRRLRALTLRFAAGDPGAMSPAAALELIRGAGAPGYMPAVAAHRTYARGRSRDARIVHPTLALFGDRDRLTPTWEVDRLRLRTDALQSVILHRAGHIAMMERPEAFNRVVLAFLDASDGVVAER